MLSMPLFRYVAHGLKTQMSTEIWLRRSDACGRHRGAVLRDALRQEGREGSGALDGDIRAVRGARVRGALGADGACRNSPLGCRDGRAGVDTQGRRHARGAEGLPRHRVRHLRVLVRGVLVPRKLAARRTVRHKRSRDGSGVGGGTARGDTALHPLRTRGEEVCARLRRPPLKCMSKNRSFAKCEAPVLFVPALPGRIERCFQRRANLSKNVDNLRGMVYYLLNWLTFN